MMCERCKNNVARVHYLHNYNGKELELNLCPACMTELENGTWSGLMNSSFLPNFNKPMMPFLYSDREDNDVCPKCGFTYSDYFNSGNFGCAKCYEVFYPQIKRQILSRLQRGDAYKGRKYAKGGGVHNTQGKNINNTSDKLDNNPQSKILAEIAKLEQEKMASVQAEDFRAAEKYRLQIVKLKAQLAGQGGEV